MIPQGPRKRGPVLHTKPEAGEERGLAPTVGMAFRQQVFDHLRLIDDGSVCIRQLHELVRRSHHRLRGLLVQYSTRGGRSCSAGNVIISRSPDGSCAGSVTRPRREAVFSGFQRFRVHDGLGAIQTPTRPSHGRSPSRPDIFQGAFGIQRSAATREYAATPTCELPCSRSRPPIKDFTTRRPVWVSLFNIV